MLIFCRKNKNDECFLNVPRGKKGNWRLNRKNYFIWQRIILTDVADTYNEMSEHVQNWLFMVSISVR